MGGLVLEFTIGGAEGYKELLIVPPMGTLERVWQLGPGPCPRLRLTVIGLQIVGLPCE
jgi:hypothetical protein